MVVGGIGKAKEELRVLLYSVYELLVFHEIGEGAEGLDTADGSYNALYRVIKKGFFKVCGTSLGVTEDKVSPPEGVSCEDRLQPHFAELFLAKLFFVSAVWFADNAA